MTSDKWRVITENKYIARLARKEVKRARVLCRNKAKRTENKYIARIRRAEGKAHRKAILVLTQPGGVLGDLWVTALGGKPKPTPLKTNAAGAEFSPDGRYITYSSQQSSAYSVFVDTFPLGGGEWQVSLENAAYPRWSKGGRELVYYEPGQNMMMSVDVELKATFHAGPPHALFTLPASQFSPMQTNPAVNWDVSADGERFVFLQSSSGNEQASAALRVTLNLPEQIREPAKK